jgi:hypothetical protein
MSALGPCVSAWGKDIMLAFLAVAAATMDASQTGSSAAQERAPQQCHSAIVAKVNGEVTVAGLSAPRRIGRMVLLTGIVSLQKRPRPRSGEMTPTHIIVSRYSFECRLFDHRKAKILLRSVVN